MNRTRLIESVVSVLAIATLVAAAGWSGSMLGGLADGAVAALVALAVGVGVIHRATPHAPARLYHLAPAAWPAPVAIDEYLLTDRAEVEDAGLVDGDELLLDQPLVVGEALDQVARLFGDAPLAVRAADVDGAPAAMRARIEQHLEEIGPWPLAAVPVVDARDALQDALDGIRKTLKRA